MCPQLSTKHEKTCVRNRPLISRHTYTAENDSWTFWTKSRALFRQIISCVPIHFKDFSSPLLRAKNSFTASLFNNKHVWEKPWCRSLIRHKNRLTSRLSHDSFYHVLVRQWLFRLLLKLWPSLVLFCQWFPSWQGFQKNKVPAAFPNRLRAHLWSRLLVGVQLNLSAIFLNLPIANCSFIFRNRVAIELRTDKDTWTSLCKHDKLYRNNLYKQASTHMYVQSWHRAMWTYI